MHFSEEDVRQALKRKDPGPEFTDRVMARIKQREETRQKSSRPGFWRWATFRFSPALVAASIVLVLALSAWIGYRGYRQHQEEARIEQEHRRLAEQKAEQQTRLALRIASEKLNHVLKAVSLEPQPEDKIRRQRL